jgi:DNA polymerase bacteriophage-type
MKRRLTKDFETRSKSNLKLEGAYKYSLDPSTQPTCLAIKVHGKSTVYFLPFEVINRQWDDLPEEFKTLWLGFIDDEFEFSAHNSFFERCIYDNILVKRYGWPKIPPRLRRCTAAKAAACALPRNLQGAGEAMKLSVQKDRDGYIAMMATCKPTKKWNAWKKANEDRDAGKRLSPKRLAIADSPEPPVFLEPDTSPEVFQVLYKYCKMDVRAEEALDDALPDLIPQEQEVWHFNQKLNWRGLKIDFETVQKISEIMAIESKKKISELDSVTMGLVTKPGARKSILEFLELEGIELPDLRAKTVEDALSSFHLSETMQTLLEIRKALSMTSTKKYHAFLNRANSDGRVRDLVLYHGASTGRDAGTGINPYNFPRGVIKVDKNRPYAAVENVVECSYQMLQLLYGDSLGMLFSSILRNMIVPSDGCELYVADFSAIEVAVLWWLAENAPGLKVLKSGLDPYKFMAAANTRKTYQEIEDDGHDRQLGKAQVLGCGFGMGAEKFQRTAWDQYRLKLTLEQSTNAVNNYRKTNAAVPALWKAYENAAIGAVEAKGKTFKAGKCKFLFEGRFLTIELASGRKLYYCDPQISWRETTFGPRKTLEFWAVNSKTKKWALERTWGGTLTENVVQAHARELMMPALIRFEKAGYRVGLSVYDEGLCEKEIGEGSLDEFTRLMVQAPTWGLDLPIKAKGWVGPRYRK